MLRTLLCIVSLMAMARARAADLETWIARQTEVAKERLLANVSPAGTVPGVIIASPSRQDPDYFYHWVRDAGLVADVLITLYEHSTEVNERRLLFQHLLDFVHFSAANQTAETLVGLGEPKFHVNGKAFLGPWGRPQNDGPALRASALMRVGRILLAAGYEIYFLNYVWPVIRNDVEYVSGNWRHASFDLWEEIKGDHFYTRMVQRRALLEAADLAADVGEAALAAWLNTQGNLIALELERHIGARGLFVENMNRVDGIWYKNSGLDTATLLGFLHTKRRPWRPFSDRTLEDTVAAIDAAFAGLYGINGNKSVGTAIGRYPEDQYYGGNPWFLTTLAFAEYHYELAAEKLNAGRAAEARTLVEKGDRYLERVRLHVDEVGAMSEQMWRDNGYMVSAADLTWSYASWLTAVWARENVTRKL